MTQTPPDALPASKEAEAVDLGKIAMAIENARSMAAVFADTHKTFAEIEAELRSASALLGPKSFFNDTVVFSHPPTDAGVSEALAAQALQKVFAIRAEGTSQNPGGYGAPYGPPFFIIDTSSAEPEVDWPGELIEQVDDVGEVGKRLRAAQVSALRAALSTAIPAGDGVPNKWEPRAWEKLNLWFFRDMSDDQRLKLFSLFGLPVDEIGKSHGHQSIALKHVRAMLSTASTAGKG